MHVRAGAHAHACGHNVLTSCLGFGVFVRCTWTSPPSAPPGDSAPRPAFDSAHGQGEREPRCAAGATGLSWRSECDGMLARRSAARASDAA
eukprot:2054554-Pleurochrysis_carterae.AAC.1